MNISAMVRKLVAPLEARVRLMVGRAVVRAVEDAHRMQELQIGLLRGELRGEVERFQNYGLTSVPEPGAEAAVVFLGGNRDHGICVAVDDRRYRPTGLKTGEVQLYAIAGQIIKLDDAGRLVISAPAGIRIETPATVEISGRLVTANAVETFSVVAPAINMNGALTASAASVRFTSFGPLEISAPSLTHNGTNVGADHVHGNVEAGNDNTGVPAA